MAPPVPGPVFSQAFIALLVLMVAGCAVLCGQLYFKVRNALFCSLLPLLVFHAVCLQGGRSVVLVAGVLVLASICSVLMTNSQAALPQSLISLTISKNVLLGATDPSNLCGGCWGGQQDAHGWSRRQLAEEHSEIEGQELHA